MTTPSFLEVFKMIILKLEDKNIEYMIVGSIASMIYGEPRLTKDLDVVIQLDLPQSKYLPTMFPGDSFYVPPTEI